MPPSSSALECVQLPHAASQRVQPALSARLLGARPPASAAPPLAFVAPPHPFVAVLRASFSVHSHARFLAAVSRQLRALRHLCARVRAALPPACALALLVP